MKDTVVDGVSKALDKAGIPFEVLNGRRHPKFIYTLGGTDFHHTVAATTSDHRAVKNEVAKVKRNIREQLMPGKVQISMAIAQRSAKVATCRIAISTTIYKRMFGSETDREKTRISVEIKGNILEVTGGEKGRYKLSGRSSGERIAGYILIQQSAFGDLLAAVRKSTALTEIPPTVQDPANLARIELPEKWCRAPIDVGDTLPEITEHALRPLKPEPVNPYDDAVTAFSMLEEALDKLPDVRICLDENGRPRLMRLTPLLLQ